MTPSKIILVDQPKIHRSCLCRFIHDDCQKFNSNRAKHSYSPFSPFTNKFCFLTTELSPFISGLDGFMVSFNKFTTVETKERKDK